MKKRINKNPTEGWITGTRIALGVTLLAAPALALGLACAAEQHLQAGPDGTFCVTPSGAELDMLADLRAPDGFATEQEAMEYWGEVMAQARYRRTMHERALKMLFQDPRWAHEDQRDDLAVAVNQTVATINGQETREEYAATQLGRLAPKT